MGSRPTPTDFGDYAERGFIAEQEGGLDWWHTCVTSALMDLCRVEGFIPAFCGIAWVLRHDADPEWVAGSDSVRAAIDVALEWLDAGINPYEVAGWLQAGCWNPAVAAQLVAAGIRPDRLLDANRRPIHWVDTNGGKIPLATAVTEWEFPVDRAVRVVTGRGYEVARSSGSSVVGTSKRGTNSVQGRAGPTG